MISNSPVQTNFSLPETIWNTEEFRMNFSGTVRHKKFNRETCYSPAFNHTVFRYRKLFEKTKSFRWNFWYCETKKSNLKSWYPLLPLIQNSFLVPQTFTKVEGLHTKFFGSVGKKLTENPDTPLSHPYIFFATRNFWNTPKSSRLSFSVMWDTKLWRKNLISSTPIRKSFSLTEIFWNRSVSN